MRFTKDQLKNTALITHKECSDGTGCAVVFLLAGGLRKNVHFVPAGHGVREFLKKHQYVFDTSDRVLIADVAPDEKTADRIEKLYGHDVTVIDHHKSSLHLKDREWCHISMEKCGSSLLFDYLFDDIHEDSLSCTWLAYLNQYVNIVNDRDMWIRKDQYSEQLSLFHTFYGQEKCVNMLKYRIEKRYPLMTDSDLAVVKVLESTRDSYIEKNSEKPLIREVDGLKVAYVFCDDHQSTLLHTIIDKHSVDVAVGIKLSGAVVSIRTREGVDAAEFAAIYGGGGHARAAGHMIDKKTMEEIVELIHP